jgi:putative membrane-bound dehydrogenase-like protein
MRRTPILAFLILTLGWSHRGPGQDDLARELPRLPPTGPGEALATFRVHPGFRLELIASEPVVRSPVAACYDADGRLYVVEMRGYPYPEPRPTGGVSLLEDVDGDGRFERRSEFVEGLSWPTGIAPFDGGVFIVAAPDLLYAKDTDGDGRADVKRVMFTGFGTQNVQGLANGLLWGVDGWVYGSSGSNGGEIRVPAKPDAKPVSVRGRDFRFKPDGSKFEAVSGGGQFGHSIDDWGHRFVCMNSNHIRQVVLPARELERNPFLATSTVTTDIAVEGGAGPVFRISPPEPWRVVRTRQRAADPAFKAKAIPSELHASGFFTSATGVTIYRGAAFPPEYRGNAFIGDVGGNLVHRKTLDEHGSTFLARRADEGSEFLASTDNWSRPVNFANTPSGTLLVLDMYRETIEHPASIPEPIKKHLDLTSGKDRGRLYDVVPEGFGRHPRPHLSRAPTADLIAHLADPDAWWRETAQRLLIEHNDPAAIPPLKDLARSRPTALARAHALWTLDALGRLDPGSIRDALVDASPGVREQAARLAPSKTNEDAGVLEGLLALASDPDPMVRFRVALSLGDVTDGRAIPALASIAARDPADKWTRTAILSSIAGRTRPMIEALAAASGFFDTPPGREWLVELATLAGSENRTGDVRAILERFAGQEAEPNRALALILGLGRGLRRSGGSLADVLTGPASARVAPLFAKASRTAEDSNAPTSARTDAIRLLALGPADEALAVLPGLLDARQPSGVQVAAVQGLAELPDRRVGPAIVGRWKAMGPSIRREAAEVLFARPDRLDALLSAIESKAIAAADLDPARRKALLETGDRKVKARASALFSGLARPDRGEVIAQWRKALELPGVADRGKGVFVKACATCHVAEGQGARVGPDLATVASRSPDDLLVHILDPNREVAPNYLNYTVALKDGRTLSGLIAEESAGALTLKRAEGATDVVLRGQIEEIASTGLSLMPEALDQGVDPQGLSDLIAYIRSLGSRN